MFRLCLIMAQFIDKAAIVAEIKRLKTIYNDDENIRHVAKYNILVDILSFIDTLEVKEIEECEKSEYGCLRTEYIIGEKPQWNIGDVLAICTSNEEGASDEQSLIEEGVYKKN